MPSWRSGRRILRGLEPQVVVEYHYSFSAPSRVLSGFLWGFVFVIVGAWNTYRFGITHGPMDRRAIGSGAAATLLLGALVFAASKIPQRVVFDFPDDKIRVRNLLFHTRSFHMGELVKFESPVHLTSKDPKFLLHFGSNVSVSVPCASGDLRIEPVVSLLRSRMKQ